MSRFVMIVLLVAALLLPNLASAQSAKTFYVVNSTAPSSSFGALQDGGAAPGTATLVTGWTTDRGNVGFASPLDWGVEQLAATFVLAVDPDGTPNNTTGDGLRTQNAYSGTFANTAWTISQSVIAVSADNTNTMRLRYRVLASADPTGATGLRELTGATQLTTSTTVNLLTTTAQTVSVTWTPGGSITLASEYLFFQVACEITLKGSNGSTQDILLRTDATNSRITTPVFTPSVLVTSVTVNPTTATISAGGTQTISATALPTNATNRNVNWTKVSGCDAADTLNPTSTLGDGLATTTFTASTGGTLPRTCVVRATAADGSGFYANTSITVNPVPVTSVSVNPTTASILAGGTQAISATALPTNATNRNVNWTKVSGCNASDTLNPTATLGDGSATTTFTAFAGGTLPRTCVVRATAADGSGFTADATVTVQAAGTITIGDGTDPSNTIIAPDGTAALDAFTLQTNGNPATLSSVTVTLTGGTNLASISIQDRSTCDQPTPYGSLASPVTGANVVNVSGLGATATSGGTNVYVCATALGHGAIVGSPTVTGYVSTVAAGTFTVSGNTDNLTLVSVTIDNTSPGIATGVGGAAQSGSVRVSWTNPADTDLQSVMVVHNTVTPVGWTPTEGQTYSAGQTLVGGAQVGCIVTSPTPGASTYCDDTYASSTSSSYYFVVFVRDLRGNWSAASSQVGPYTPSAFVNEGSTIAGAPMVSIVNPMKGAVVTAAGTGSYRIQIRVSNGLAQGGIAGLLDLVPGGAVELLGYSTNNGSSWTYTTGTPLTVHDTLTSGTLTGRTYEVVISSPAAGSYVLRAQVSSSVVANVKSNRVPIQVVTSGAGDGNLLVRDNSSQICNDCHAIKSHTSETSVSARGSWSTNCRDCHTPHQTTNIELVGQQITPPELSGPQTPRTVAFYNKTGFATSSYASSAASGPCQVCHTRTNYYRSDGTDDGVTLSGGHNPSSPCASCHLHDKGFAAVCTDCHGTASRTPTVAGTDPKLTAAPPAVATKTGQTVVAVAGGGAHVAHLDKITWRSTPLQCSNCHTMPNTHQATTQTDVAWAGLASAGGVVPTPAAGAVSTTWTSTPTCTNWCHGIGLAGGGGSNKTPSWTGTSTSAACGTCHGQSSPTVTPLPPVSANLAEDHPQNSTCSSCHGVGLTQGYTASTVGADAKVIHVNGTIDKPVDGCTACHGKLTVVGASNTNPAAAPGYDALSVDTHGSSSRTQTGVGAHIKHVNAGMMPGKTCDVCHGSPVPSNHDHANGTVATAWNPPANSKGVVPTWNGTTCTNYCHSSGLPIGGTVTLGSTATWTSTVSMLCTNCHGYVPATNRHATHYTTYGIGCEACHSATVDDSGSAIVSGGGLHVNGTNDVAFTTTDLVWAPYVTGGGYSTTLYTCSSTYCHSNGQSAVSPFGSPNLALAWTATRTCSDCHGGYASPFIASGKHTNHANNAPVIGTNYFCGDCHKNTVAAGTNSPITTATNHVDRVKTVSIADRGTYPSTDTGPTCSATYCHSDGQRGGANTKVTATWSDAAWTGSICVKCHGTGGLTYGAPDYANGGVDTSTANSHGKHVGSAADCATCHNTTTSNGTTILAGGLHTDGVITMGWDTTKAGAAVGFVSGTYTAPSTYTSATCTNVKCHGYNATALKWGGASQKCSDCHTAAADTDSYAFGTAGIVSTTEWSAVGHGQSTFGANTFPTIAAGTPCLYCHDGSVSHGVTGNPFRLLGATGAGGAVSAGNYSAATASSANQVCLNCHATAGANGVYLDAANPLKTSTKKIDAYHAGAGHTTRNGGTRCWDCHDPHGDGTNIKMMASKVTQTSTDNHSWAATRISSVSFTANATGTDYANATATSLCRACHVSALHYSTTLNDGHNSGAKCIACHAHDQTPANNGFYYSTACNACHNAPPTLGKHLSHDETTFAETSYANNARHASATQYGFACNTCHNGTHQNSNNPYAVQVVFGSFDAKAVGGTYAAGAAQTADTAPTGMLSYNWSSGTCSTTYCHSNGTPVGGAVLNNAPTWTEAAWVKTGTTANECTKCHKMAADNTGLATSQNLSHAHYVHTTTAATSGYYFNCSQCHFGEATGQADYPTNNVTYPAAIGDKTKHLNGGRDVAFDPAVNPGTPGYNQGPAYTCTNTYCHSNGTSAASPPANTSIAWNTSATCASCHGGYTGTIIATGKHTNHANNAPVIGTNYFCGDCHKNTVAAGTNSPITTATNHVDRVKTVSIADRGTYPSTDTGPTCSATYCHSDGQRGGANTKVTATWSDAAWTGSICVKCHGTGGLTYGAPDYANGGTNTATSNSHAKHVSSAPDCATCHNTTTSNGTTILAGGLHTDGVITMGFDTTKAGTGVTFVAGTYTAPSTYTSATCTNVKCHGYNATAVVWGATLTCLNCHTGTEGGALGDGAANAVDDEWTTKGHGSTAGGAFTSALGGCDYCHDLGAAHTPTASANPYRLRYSATANTLCLQCHLTGDAGININSAGTALTLENSSLNVDAAHDGAKHAVGEGGMFCWDCHDPHGAPTNIKMIKASISKTSNTYGVPTATGIVNFTTQNCTAPAIGCNVEATNNPRQGVCQACHDPSKPTTESTKYWRWDGTDDPDGAGGAAPYTSTHNSTKACSSCHAHKDKFAGKGGGSDCWGCHGPGQGNTRALSGDFTKQSHHVRTNAGAFPGTSVAGAGTNADCVVCHSEGQIITAYSADCATGTLPMTCTNPTYHANGKIDLRDVDTAAPAKDGAGATFTYDKVDVASSAGAAANWNSGNQKWREWTSGVDETGGATLPASAGLDKFCLNCHDSGGAAQIASFKLSTEASRTATDPFWDGTGNITNTYDTYNRSDQAGSVGGPTAVPPATGGHVIDIKSKVSCGTPTTCSSAPPAQGTFSRHAIRGQSTSKYSVYTGNIGTGFSTIYDAARFTSMGTDQGGKPNWNDTSVMGCADCHTVDGANTTAGNAHGSDSEYLLKDITGGATEGAYNSGTDICGRCHSAYTNGHTGGNGSDFEDSVLQTGSARLTSSTPKGKTGTIFGLACLNCHGGGQGNGTGTGDTNGFGWIHGTSQVFPQGASGGGGTRNAYRFMNGSSLRFFQPGGANWDTGGGTCYTLGTVTTFGNCTQHNTGTTMGPSLARPLSY